MTPPEAGAPGNAPDAGMPPAVSVCAAGEGPAGIQTLTKRADFLRAASAARQGMPGLLLQARQRPIGDDTRPGPIRVGFTCSKKIGNAVARNRAKRRLREAARQVLPGAGRAGWDYVLVGRPGATIERDFAALVADLSAALARVHAARGAGRP